VRRFDSSPRRHLPAALVCLAISALMTAACGSGGMPSTPTSGARLAIDIPSPLTGPGRPPLDEAERDALAVGWNDLLAGRLTAARSAAAPFGSPQARLLRLQIDAAEAPSAQTLDGLKALTERNPRYAAAIVTLSVVAEKLGYRALALETARQSSDLWPSGPFSGRLAELTRRWVSDPIADGRKALDAGDSDTALAMVDGALELDPENRDGLLLRAEILMSLDRDAEAGETLSMLGSLPEAVFLRARLASEQGRWQQAMDLLGVLPQDFPGRDRLLRRAQLMWRMSILPPHVREAVASNALTREQLAVIIGAMVPSLEVQEGGETPLMTDIIGLPSQRAILTVARLDVMPADRVARLFHPARPVDTDEVRDAVDAVAHLTGSAPPSWCPPDADEDHHCVVLTEPVTGMGVVDVLLSLETGDQS